MRLLPRVAVGSLDPATDRQPIVWGMLAALYAAGYDFAHFCSTAWLPAHDAARSLSGSGCRQLDSWAMSRSVCIRTMLRAAESIQLGIVEGTFDVPRTPSDVDCQAVGGRLDALCDCLDLPRLAIVDLATVDPCNLPKRPDRLDGLLLDRAIDAGHAIHWQTNFESLWKVPVLGWMDRAESLRSLCRTLPAGRDPSPELCAALGRRLAANLRLDNLLALADRSPLPSVPADDMAFDLDGGPLRIAIAYDEEYCGYFPDTLDLLEAAGAELCDFSPLRSGAIPDGADVVYFGCGHPERRPEVLAGNHCLLQSLREFAAAGGRIYGEGSGLAYLCRELDLGHGRRFPMAGLLPAVARRILTSGPPEPVEITFAAECWLIEEGDFLRGYRHPGWVIEPQGNMITYAEAPEQRLDLIGRGNVVGSRLLVNLAANEHLLRRFVTPAVPVGSAARRER
ncbi:MAG: hypothetical protein L0211_18950 [Planctomycetaceae bacterium]|nr:hypothetical protein [Planctomycetaceae bacterium]